MSKLKYDYYIGIGITTKNRRETAKEAILNIIRMTSPMNKKVKIFVFDDYSDIPFSKDIEGINVRYERESVFTGGLDFIVNRAEAGSIGIARAKNKCLEELDDCEHIFLFDDDIYPIKKEWYLPYIHSKEPHLMYIFTDFRDMKLNDTVTLHVDSQKVAYSHPRGSMLYFHNSCLQIAGGFDPAYTKWGYEHADLSCRIFNLGLTSYRFMDVAHQDDLFYCHDEHRSVASTVWGSERDACIRENKPRYLANYHRKDYIPYNEPCVKGLLMSTYYTKAEDPQRGTAWGYDAELIRPYIESVEYKALPVHILSDSISEVQKDFPNSHNAMYGVNTIEASEVQHNIYFQRWIDIYDALSYLDPSSWGFVFCTDISDVEVLKNPFPHMKYGKLYVGDEPTTIGNCPWLIHHHQNNILQKFFESHTNKTVLNAGLLGGDILTVRSFLRELIDFHMMCKEKVATGEFINHSGNTDMGAFNYIAYTKFHDRIVHGRQVNTVFKANQRNPESWFKHK